MPLLTCPNCSASFASDAAPGSLVVCTYCGTSVLVPKLTPPSAGVSLTTQGNVTVGGDIVGGDFIQATSARYADPFDRAEALIDARPNDLNTDQARLKEAVRKIRLNAQREQGRDYEEVEHELKYLYGNAPDIFDVTASALTDPALQALARNVMRLAETPAPPPFQTPPPPPDTPPVFDPASLNPVEIAQSVSWLASLPTRLQRASGAIIAAVVIGCCVLPVAATVACSALLFVITRGNAR